MKNDMGPISLSSSSPTPKICSFCRRKFDLLSTVHPKCIADELKSPKIEGLFLFPGLWCFHHSLPASFVGKRDSPRPAIQIVLPQYLVGSSGQQSSEAPFQSRLLPHPVPFTAQIRATIDVEILQATCLSHPAIYALSESSISNSKQASRTVQLQERLGSLHLLV